MECSLPGSSVHDISQARGLKWVAISFSAIFLGSSQPRDQTQVSCIGRWILYCWATWDAHIYVNVWLIHSAVQQKPIQHYKATIIRRRQWHPTPVLFFFFNFFIFFHSSTLAWKIPWTEEPGGLQSMGSLRVRHDWATSLSLFTFMHWRRKWQPTPVFSPGESQGRGSLVGCRLWGHTESDTTEVT